jgi:hypothetical protein
MFSPSPEHDAFERTKMMMMTANVKRESPKSDKQDRRSSTPNKRDKRSDLSTTPKSQADRKLLIPKLENTSSAPASLAPDASVSQMKKRPFASVDDSLGGDFNRDSKSRKVDVVKSEPAMMKQPIETNPDIVKSLLQECYTSNKFDFGMDSPLDVINPEPTSHTSIVVSTYSQVKLEVNESMVGKDNGHDEDHHKRNKSKKKKEKHRHKKKKSHKSDREDRDERKDTSLKIILSNKSDSKSSPESVHTPGGLRIKIPIKDVNKTDLASGPPPMGLPPAPLKLKISKEKIGGFNNSAPSLSDGGSSSTSHKKKDKDRSKSKSSKHGNNNNNSEFKDVGGYQHQQLSVNKVSALS